MDLQGERHIQAGGEGKPAAARHNALWWLVCAAIVAAAIYFLMR
jgi:hypothetical protein